MLADEPTGNLDSQSGAEIMALLRELHAEGLTIVLVTHEPSIAAAADRTIRMHDGQIVEDVRKPTAAAACPVKAITGAPELRMSRRLYWDLLLLNLQQAARGLWANKMRTCLSALGHHHRRRRGDRHARAGARGAGFGQPPNRARSAPTGS